MPYADVELGIAKQIPGGARHDARQGARGKTRSSKDMAAKDPKVQRGPRHRRRLEGMSRHASVHAAGVVIAPRTDHRLTRRSYKGARDEITTQWNMKEGRARRPS
jgi:DNA polymerase-3 subunit alpha